jgi:hypothetical protein
VELVVLDDIDLVDEIRCGGCPLDGRSAFVWVDQRNSSTVNAGNGMGRKLRHLAQQFDHSARAGDKTSQPAQPGIQADIVRVPLGGGRLWLLWPFAPGLGVVVGHGQR